MPLDTLLALVYLNQQLHTTKAEPGDTRAERLSKIVSALYDIATGRSSLDEVLAYVVEAARAGTEASASVIALRDNDKFVCCARSGPNAPDLGARLNPHTGISGECIRTGAIMRSDETWTDPRVNAAVCRRLRVRSMIAVPVHHCRKVVGVLEVLSERPAAFGDEQTIVLQLLSSLVTHALQNEEAGTATKPESREVALRATSHDAPLAAALAKQQPSGSTAPVQQFFEPTDQHTADLGKPLVPHPSPSGEGASDAVAGRATCEPEQQASTPAQEIAEPAPIFEAGPAATTDAVADDFFATLHLTQNRDPQTFRIFATAAAALLAIAVCAVIFARHSRPVQPKQMVQTRYNTPAPAPVPPVAAGPAQLSTLEIESKPESTTIKLKLDSKVQFNSDRLHNPERVYFDLSDTDLDKTLAPAYARRLVNDARVAQVRVAQSSGHVTRVVLDLKCQCDYSAVQPDTAPSELSVVIQPPAKAPVATAAPQPVANAPNKTAIPVSATPTTMRTVSLPARMVVVLDPGHGGPDLGTVGPNGLQEKDLALDIAQRLGRLLKENLGAAVLYTRSDDQFVSLEARSAMANQAHADLVLSIHANSSNDPSARGVETYFFPAGQAAVSTVSAATEASTRRLANLIQRHLQRALRREDARIRDRGVKQAHFVLLTNAEVPAVLTEVAFLSSPSDERKLLFPPARDTIAAALYRGIAEFFKSRARATVGSVASQSAQTEVPLRGSAPAAAQ